MPGHDTDMSGHGPCLAALRKSALLGACFETLALGQLIRHFTNRGDPSRVYFYRDHQGNEVDFVIPVGEKLHLYECKWAETPDPRPRGFVELRTILTPDPAGGSGRA